MKGILIGSGNYFASEKFLIEKEDADILIAVDGGMDYYLELNIKPDVLIGDLDSISKDGIKKLEKENNKIIIKKHPIEKDSTDMELALDYLIHNNCTEVVIFGGTGLRLDHTLGNIYLLNKLVEKNIRGKIIDRNNTITIIEDYYEVNKELGKYVTIIPITEKGAIVSLKGFKYDLDKYNMRFGSTIGISNKLVQDPGYIKVDDGKIILFVSKD